MGRQAELVRLPPLFVRPQRSPVPGRAGHLRRLSLVFILAFASKRKPAKGHDHIPVRPDIILRLHSYFSRWTSISSRTVSRNSAGSRSPCSLIFIISKSERSERHIISFPVSRKQPLAAFKAISSAPVREIRTATFLSAFSKES